MKKIFLFITLAMMLCLGFASSSSALICLTATGCNHHVFGISGGGGGIYGLHGYEYGCGYDNRISYGSLVIVGSYAYVSISMATPQDDYVSHGDRCYVITLSNDTSTYTYQYLYISGGSVSGHGGTGTGILDRNCNPSLATEGAGYDEAL